MSAEAAALKLWFQLPRKYRKRSQQPYRAQKLSSPALTHLDNVVVYVLGIPVDQVDLFSVDILHRLLVQTVVVHVFVVGFVYVPLFSDERRMHKLLSESVRNRRK